MPSPEFEVLFASSEEELRAAQSLRYDVFVRDLGADGPMVDHVAGLEKDHFDAFSRHLLLLDRARGGSVSQQVVGVYRLLDRDGAHAAGGFYSEHEFDLSALTKKTGKLLELGRSCLHQEYRGGTGMYHLWSALASFVLTEKIDILFGVASFRGTDRNALAVPLAHLSQHYMAPKDLRPIARHPNIAMDETSNIQVDRKAAMTQIPALIKAYLRLGGCVGQGAFMDVEFNTTDVCLVLDVNQMSDKQRKIYAREM